MENDLGTTRKCKHMEWKQKGEIHSEEERWLTGEASTEKRAFELHLNQRRTSVEGGWRKGYGLEVGKSRMCLVSGEEAIVTAL